MIARLTATYLGIFACVLIALGLAAYWLIGAEYTSLMQPALGTPEGSAAYGLAMRHVGVTIVEFAIPLLIVVGIASYFLARLSLLPLIAAQERERRFAADAAHELRSPLATIATIAQASRSAAADRARDDFETIAQTALEASALIGDLLTLAREPRPTVLHAEPVDLGAIVAATVAEFERQSMTRNIALSATPVSAIVHGDERRLKEVARNLLNNALRHASSNVRISTRSDSKYAYLIVEDDGDGIRLDQREKVFERFYRSSDDGQGTGLGLAIVRWVAHAHGGEISAGDAATGGAEFTFRVPKYLVP
ncbi:MAG: HAMP domain-containing histidine kinase [Candidatus Eremiobacteraeota bacterium]|nr:HAMP domain-containing histidine kinase [Candidatus Eremiobacteraeota bacterium]